jgi:ABC-type transport system involved in multi-copper enzyme maturation permease subunit
MMMLNLLLKDLRAFGKSLLKITVLSLIVITLFIFLHEGSWFIYIVMAAGQISFVIGYYLMSEKIHRGEILICSLPVTRKTIIRAKYLVALLIVIGGITLWFLYACLLNFIFTDLPGNFQLFTNPIVIFSILFYFSFFISAFVPIVTIFDKIWALTNLSILFAAIFIVPFSLYFEFKGSFHAKFEAGNILFFGSLILIMILLSWFSIALSTRLFKQREL